MNTTFLTGQGGLPMLRVVTPGSTADIYLHGAHVTHFQRTGEQPLLFMSGASRFQADAPIRGGIPIIFPWFGKPEGRTGQHGFARLRAWTLTSIETSAEDAVTVTLELPFPTESGDDAGGLRVRYRVTVGATLEAELRVFNGSSQPLTFENCLHTYFAVGDVTQVHVAGLSGTTFLDQPAGYARRVDTEPAIRVAGEVDRAYVNTTATVDIHDRAWRRTIRVAKSGSHSTVVWNPWIAKSQAMADFGDDEYPRMICVESGNIGENRITLAPGDVASLGIALDTRPLADA